MCILSPPTLHISIHAPTRGATKPFIYKALRTIISIHAPTRGATLTKSYGVVSCLFQSTLPREERPKSPPPYAGSFAISIHAPTRGATFKPSSRGGCNMLHFNPRSHERSDLSVLSCLFLFRLFQSTLPREERLTGFSYFISLPYFNPRSHERSDPCPHQVYHRTNLISIHAPTRGATTVTCSVQCSVYNFNPRSHERSDFKGYEFSANSYSISIHAPTRGATIPLQSISAITLISIHAPTRGATLKSQRKSSISQRFQSTLPREERHADDFKAVIKQLFQSTLPREERPYNL